MIAILMSTYNGECYLKDQIESILSQTYKDWILYIRDDGSTDRTIRIIKTYVGNYPDKIIYEYDRLGNLGSGRSFMKLLSSIDSDYYMFCDQDDVWLPSKIEKTYLKMKSLEMNHAHNAIAVFTNLYIVDKSLNIISDSLWKRCHRNPENVFDLYKLIVYGSPSYGCTMMFNRITKSLLFPYKNWKFHDHWTILIVSHFGYAGFVDEPLIYYRQHGENVAGFQDSGYSVKQMLKCLLFAPIRYVKESYLYMNHFKDLPFPISMWTLMKYKIVKWGRIIFGMG
ncbi:glycosyltransferase family 2 protein [Parabacteroides faecis]|uniref:Glycosyltransferase involved in cell wall biosynthesis n=1 Tax=Parabacteroides faecis TaxID=1217282 RepID=A0ABR6KIH3_9BACT|nr:glycosyltransferase family 2 protein [Parabacteroides faecis]MBB4621315.1 glycosyltransferase involved in cell wall biosynthesis [Parabacteroides faecis]GGJ87635.1 hypothetical protein GCM10007084_09010 [Parabacteroides faecis]